MLSVKVIRKQLNDPELITREQVTKAGIALVQEGARGSKLLAPVNDGNLRDSIRGEWRGLGGRWFSDVPYAPYVENGSRPHWPPIDPLKEWARKVLGDEDAGYAIAASIAKNGTKAQPMFRPSADSVRKRARSIIRAVV